MQKACELVAAYLAAGPDSGPGPEPPSIELIWSQREARYEADLL